ERYHLRQDDLDALRSETIAFGKALKDQGGLATEEVVDFVVESADDVGKGSHKDRTAAHSVESITNFVIVAGEVALIVTMFGPNAFVEGAAAWAFLRSRREFKDAFQTAEVIY